MPDHKRIAPPPLQGSRFFAVCRPGGVTSGEEEYTCLQVCVACPPLPPDGTSTYTCSAMVTFYTTYSGYPVKNDHIQYTLGKFDCEGTAFRHASELLDALVAWIRTDYRVRTPGKVACVRAHELFDEFSTDTTILPEHGEDPESYDLTRPYKTLLPILGSRLNSFEMDAEKDVRRQRTAGGLVRRIAYENVRKGVQAGVYELRNQNYLIVMPKVMIPGDAKNVGGDEGNEGDCAVWWQVRAPTHAFERACASFNAMVRSHPCGSYVQLYDLSNLQELLKLDADGRSQVCLSCTLPPADEVAVRCASPLCYALFHSHCTPLGSRAIIVGRDWKCSDCIRLSVYDALQSSLDPLTRMMCQKLPLDDLAHALTHADMWDKLQNMRPVLSAKSLIAYRAPPSAEWVEVEVQDVRVGEDVPLTFSPPDQRFAELLNWDVAAGEFNDTGVEVRVRVDGYWGASFPLHLYRLDDES